MIEIEKKIFILFINMIKKQKLIMFLNDFSLLNKNIKK